ncbi:hypothetical protein D3C78_1842400 [compost metagenome]
MKSPSEIQQLLARHKPGDKITVDFDHRGITKTVSVELKENPRLEVVTYETAGKNVTDAMKKLREDWLGSKVKYY